jgi:electron transport complex protein RnfG
VIVLAFEFTRPIIQRNQVNARQRAIAHVLPGTQRSVAFRWTDDGKFELTADNSTEPDLVFAGYDSQGALVGLALEASGMGYADNIRLIYGYSLESEAIIGTKVLETRETPGLGDRIEFDKQFLKNFVRLDVRVAESGDRLVHPIEFVKAGQKTADWQIDGISGATISSRAITEALNKSASQWVPRIRQRRSDFLSKGNEQPHGN